MSVLLLKGDARKQKAAAWTLQTKFKENLVTESGFNEFYNKMFMGDTGLLNDVDMEVVREYKDTFMAAAAEAARAYVEDEARLRVVEGRLDKAGLKIKKYKEKYSEHRGMSISEMSEISALVGAPAVFTVVKDVPIRPMNKEEAVQEMEKLGYNFWLFMEKDARQMQVVFKRLDNTYGLLLPVKK